MAKAIKILLIDDEPDFTTPVAFWMKTQGHAVTVAKSCDEALPALRAQRPDVIFLDKTMPGCDGIETLAKIREIDRSVPIVMMSAYTGDIEKQGERPKDVAMIFYKGDDFSKITDILRSVLP